MMDEVKERVELIVSVQGSRRISRENLEFLFAKYELPEAEREQVLTYCADRGILVFSETGEEPARKTGEVQSHAPGAEKGKRPEAGEGRRGGLLSRLFGHR